MPNNFHFKENKLHCEQFDIDAFSQQTETPFYIYSKNELIENCQRVIDAGKDKDFLACYAFKANYNPYLLRIIRDMGFGADVVSGGELQFALKLGFDPHKIVFSGVGKTAAEIELAIGTGIHSLNVESAEELKLVSAIAEKLQKPTRIALRVNPDIEAETHEFISTGKHINKFGITQEEAFRLYQLAKDDKFLDPHGIHVHIGSQITKKEPFLKTVDFLLHFSHQLKQSGVPISYLDLGGGIGINYDDDFQSNQSDNEFVNETLPAYLNGFKDSGLKLVAELGRSVIGTTGLLITEVLYRKETPAKKFVVVDAAMNNLIRPSLYSAHHEIVPLAMNSSITEKVDVVGPICESTDFFAKDRLLPTTEQGDYLAIGASGAYGQALASNYNLRPSVKEFLVDKDKVECIYEGRTIDNIFDEFGMK